MLKPPRGIFPLLCFSGFEYSERNVLGVNAASKWCQELSELSLAKSAKPFYLGYKDAGLIGVSCVATDNHLDDYMWYTLHNIVSRRGQFWFCRRKFWFWLSQSV